MLFDQLMTRLIPVGPLTVIDAAGRRRIYGRAAAELSPVTFRLADRLTEYRILRNPSLSFGEAYMDGRLVMEAGDIRDLLNLIRFNTRWDRENPLRERMWHPGRMGALLDGWNRKGRARRNAAHHYDLPHRLYELFLDSDLQYSCAYYRTGREGLEQAQADKKAHIAAKLLLKPGQRVLDIGCGWGGLALYLARIADVEVVGITLSEEQLRTARSRAEASGMTGKVRFELADYREVEGRYDRIVSVGMFEHVGPRHYRAFFNQCRHLLSPDGLALIHSIGRADGPGATDPWLARYIFPGGTIPALSQIIPAVEKAWLWITDVETLRPHYRQTLTHWYQRTNAAEAEIKALCGERFFRTWQFYLAGGISAFTHDSYLVYQIQLSASRDAAPATRDYMADVDQAGMRW